MLLLINKGSMAAFVFGLGELYMKARWFLYNRRLGYCFNAME